MTKKVYVGVNGKARRVKKIYVGVGAALPSGYTQVEYIQSSGSQYINTGFKPNNASRMVLDIDVVARSGQAALFGARNGGGSSGFCVFTYNNNAGYQVDYGTQQFTGVGGNSSGRHILDLHQHVLYVDANPVNIASTQSFSCSYNAYLFSISSGGNVMTNYSSAAKLYACQIYDNGTKVRDFVPCKNSSGTVGLYDTVNSKFYTNEGTGTFTAGASLPSGGVARKVKKGYIGVGGVARLFFSSEPTLSYYGRATDFSEKRSSYGATRVGNYALFGGGSYNSTAKNLVEAYNSSLTKSTPTALSKASRNIAATSVGNYALFAGGRDTDGNKISTVNAYNASLTRSTPTALSVARYDLFATNIGNYALFAGGYASSSSTTVDAYNASLTRSTPAALSAASSSMAAGTNGSYAIFGGFSASTTAVDAYSASLTKVTTATLSAGRASPRGASVGEYVLVCGGTEGYTYGNRVDAFNTSLARTVPSTLSFGSAMSATASMPNYALIGGGLPSPNANVNAYNSSLIRSVQTSLSVNRSSFAATSVGKYAIFGGDNSNVNVDVYQEIE